MKVGEQTSFALMVMLDVMFPEKISVGTNTVIGYNTTILAHEYLIKEYRLGAVEIGSEVMIGANSTILPGVTIGDGAIVSAGTLVHKDVLPGTFVGGNPMRVIYTKEELTQRCATIQYANNNEAWSDTGLFAIVMVITSQALHICF